MSNLAQNLLIVVALCAFGALVFGVKKRQARKLCPTNERDMKNEFHHLTDRIRNATWFELNDLTSEIGSFWERHHELVDNELLRKYHRMLCDTARVKFRQTHPRVRVS